MDCSDLEVGWSSCHIKICDVNLHFGAFNSNKELTKRLFGVFK
jgi:hypothetical protein